MKARVKKTYVVYSITNQVNGKRYIGVTYNEDKRKYEHLRMLRAGNHHSAKLQRAFDKYRESSFVWEILERCIKAKDHSSREIRWIALFDSFKNGYNLTEGGVGRSSYGTSCTWNGVEYISYTSAARALGIDITTMIKRVENGYTCDADMPRPNKEQPCTWNGIEYESVSAAALDLGINRMTMQERLERGHTCDADVRPSKIACIWNGKQYVSANDAARDLGVSGTTIIRRIALGYTCDADMKNPPATKQDKSA